MSDGGETLQILLACANALVAVALFIQLRRAGVAWRGLPLVLAFFFLMRAFKRLLEPIGLDDGTIEAAIDVVLLLLLLVLALRIGTIVAAFRAQTEQAERSRVSYDQALSNLSREQDEPSSRDD
ncbi:MAG: hypothetical protein KDC46_09825 [Thermoleophilia bacterium]|nr:hypothetical protein [Thermoleophilia bacterium]